MENSNSLFAIQQEPAYFKGLQLCSIVVNDSYLNEWDAKSNDFVCIVKDGQLLRNTLYRKGGMGNPNLGDDYFMLMKYVEAYYDKEWLKEIGSNSDPKHLESRWCIIDKNGNEVIEFQKHTIVYLINGSCIYRIADKYYNLKTGELYCTAYHKVESKQYLFLENNYDDDKSRRGVMMINKKDGTFTLFINNK